MVGIENLFQNKFGHSWDFQTGANSADTQTY